MGSRRQTREAGKSPLNALERMDWEWMDLGALTEDPRLQMRIEGLDEKHVRDLMATIEDKGIDDPITVIREGKTHWLADGFHRVEATRRVAGDKWQKQEIKAIVLTGTFDDAKQIARKANLRHGKALSPASRKAILFDMIRNNEEINGIAVKRLSNGVLGSELGVHQGTIGDWLKEIIEEESTSGKPLVTLEDRAVVFGRDGREIKVAEIASSNRKTAAELAERRAAEEAERKRGLPALDKIRVITQYLISKYRDTQAKKGKPLFDDPDKGFKWCFQVSNPVFVVDIDWENQFLREYGAKPVGLYREFLRLADQAIFTEADMDGWSDEELADWVTAMKQRPPRQPNAATFQQTGMAQPKNPNIEIPQPKVLGRHRPEAAATKEAADGIPPCPFSVGQWVKLVDSEKTGKVKETEWAEFGGWRVLADIYLIDRWYWAKELTDATPPATETGTHSEPPIECPFKVGDRVILKRNPKPVSVVKSVRQLQDGTWRLTMTTEDGYEFYEVPANLAFAPAAVVVEDQAVVPFRTGDILKDIQTGEYVEVVGFSSDGSITVQGEDGSEYQGQAGDFEKALHITPEQLAQASSKPSNGEYKPSNGTQTQMVENYMALMKLIQEATESILAIKKFDFNLQYLQTPEVLGGIWDALADMRDQAMDTFAVAADRLNTMSEQGLPYDPKLAQETLSKGMQRA